MGEGGFIRDAAVVIPNTARAVEFRYACISALATIVARIAGVLRAIEKYTRDLINVRPYKIQLDQYSGRLSSPSGERSAHDDERARCFEIKEPTMFLLSRLYPLDTSRKS